MGTETERLEDLIYQPHHVSATHPQMMISNRAAQFAPFQALTGYGEAIRETERLTDKRIELDESEKEKINLQLLWMKDRQEECPNVKLTYFVPDEKKEGGKYVTVSGRLKKMKESEHLLVLEDGTRIKIEEIVEIELMGRDEEEGL